MNLNYHQMINEIEQLMNKKLFGFLHFGCCLFINDIQTTNDVALEKPKKKIQKLSLSISLSHTHSIQICSILLLFASQTTKKNDRGRERDSGFIAESAKHSNRFMPTNYIPNKKIWMETFKMIDE